MNEQFRSAFGHIRADEKIKMQTLSAIREEAIRIETQQNNQSGSVRSVLTASHIHFRRYAAVLCGLFLLLGVGSIGSSYFKPVSYISIDVNPSLELALNRFDRVIGVESYNDDGKWVISDVELKNKYYKTAVEDVLENAKMQSYLTDESLLVFTVVSGREEELLQGIQECHSYRQGSMECHSVGEENMEDAHHCGMSIGKYEAYLKLSQKLPSLTIEECEKLSMCEINRMLELYGQEKGRKGQGEHLHEEDGSHHSEEDCGHDK